MITGKKSLLFGVHQFIWHPITVLLAWYELYRMPNFKELVCIFIHDWGYWFCENMDDDKGKKHPEFGANLAYKLFGSEYFKLCLYHSRHYSKRNNMEPSKLCWADKLSIKYEITWFYLFRANLSGEIKEYRRNSLDFISSLQSDLVWFNWIKERTIQQGLAQKINLKLVD